jgi:CRP-like cAMP-binding protein
MVDLATIQNAAIFDGLTQSEIQELTDIGREEHVAKGDRLFHRGDEANNLYIVKGGRFALTMQLRMLDDLIEMAVEEKATGDALGWSSLVDPFRSIYSAYCTLDGSVAAFARRDLEDLMSSDTHLGYRFSRNLCQLIGTRIRALQELWIEEIQQSMARVDYWTHTKLNDDLVIAAKPPRKHGHRRRRASH